MVDSYYWINFCLLVPFVLLALLLFDYTRMITPKNIILGFVTCTMVFGYLLLPISILAPVKIPYGPPAFRAMITSYHYFLFGYAFILAGIFIVKLAARSGRQAIDRKAVIYSELNNTRLLGILVCYLAVSTGIIMFTFFKLGVVPILAEHPMSAKFFQFQVAQFVKIRPFYFIAISTLPFTSFFLLYIVISTRKSSPVWLASLICAVIASLVLLSTYKRGPLLFPFVTLAAVYALMGRIGPLKLATVIILAIILGSYMWYIRRGGLDLGPFLMSFSTNFFVEIREFGRVVLAFEQQNLGFYDFFMGGSFLAGLTVFIPTVMNPLKQQYHIGRATLRLLGSDPDAIGPPRIGYIGECYMNFGIIGVLIVSLLMGISIELVNRYFHKKMALKQNQFLPMLYVFFFVGIIMSFFQCGTQGNIYILARLILFLPIYFLARKRLINDVDV